MAKVIVLLFVASFALAIPATSDAIYFSVGEPYFAAGATLTKVGDNAYDFDFSWGLDYTIQNLFPPSGVYDPQLGGTPYYFLYPPGGFASQASGPFGLATDLTGYGYGSLNFYSAPYSFGGTFRINQTPGGPVTIWGYESIAMELYRPDGGFAGRNLVGSVEGTVNLFGDIPTTIDQSTSWNVTPEPPVWLLCLVGLLPVLGFHRHDRTQLDPVR